MSVGIDDFDDFNESLQDETVILEDLTQELIEDSSPEIENSEELADNDTIVEALLKAKGIDDSSKIKYENDNGEIEEVDWNSLNTEDKLNILNTSQESIEDSLDDSEIQLINAIRSSLLTPAEYVQYLLRSSVEAYLQNIQNQSLAYSIDLYSDEELYVMDLISKSEDITEDEAMEALERAKANDTLFKKQMIAIRNEYKKAEDESHEYTRLQQEQESQDRFNQFAEKIEDSIINFKEFSGCELNMDNEDMQSLYDFITGFDNAGNNWFSKALNDPDTVVLMAWFLLNGEKMISDMNEYYQREITNVRKESYNKGLKDAAKRDTPTITYKPKGKSKASQSFDDLDDF